MTEDNKPKRTQEETDKILSLAKKEFKRSAQAFSENFKDAIEILKFKHGIDQWTSEEQQNRKDDQRPCLINNQMPRFSNQVCGEMRENKIQIKVCPAGENSNQENANIRAGMIKNIEYLSNGEFIQDHGAKMLVDSGFAAARVLSRYTQEDPFLQELYIESIDNPFSCHPDPDAKDRFYSDGEYFFIDSFMTEDVFKELYPDKEMPGKTMPDGPEGVADEHWYDPDKVIAREYLKKEYTIKTMCLLSDGQKLEESEAIKFIEGIKTTYAQVKADQEKKKSEALAAGQEFTEQPIDDTAVPEILKKREIEEPCIKWYKITATEILEENEWPGSLIPVAFATAEYTNIAGKKYYNGMFKHSKDVQKLLNNVYTSVWETVSLMPKTPIQASAKMVEGYENDYLDANQKNFPLLKYQHDEKFPGMKPERMQIGQAPQALFALLAETKQDFKDSVGMYNADIGDKGPEISGKAILARQTPGDTATFIYPDTKAAWWAHVGKILNAALHKFYDTERDARLRGEDGKDSFVKINTTAGKAANAIKENPQKYSGMEKKGLHQALKKGPATPFNSITEGKYDVVVTTGPAYSTQRQEAAENILKISQFSNRMDPLDKVFAIMNLDIPGSEAWVNAWKKRLPAGTIPLKEGEEPTPPPPPPPQAQLAMAKVQLELKKAETEKIKYQCQLVKLQNELTQSKSGVKQEIINSLDEITAPHHPADLPTTTPESEQM